MAVNVFLFTCLYPSHARVRVCVRLCVCSFYMHVSVRERTGKITSLLLGDRVGLLERETGEGGERRQDM